MILVHTRRWSEIMLEVRKWRWFFLSKDNSLASGNPSSYSFVVKNENLCFGDGNNWPSASQISGVMRTGYGLLVIPQKNHPHSLNILMSSNLIGHPVVWKLPRYLILIASKILSDTQISSRDIQKKIFFACFISFWNIL